MQTEESTSPLLVDQSSAETSSLSDVLNDSQREIFFIVNFIFLCEVIILFGIISNIINIVIFIKQGFSNTINISLCGLAISDFCCLVTLLWLSICFNPLVIDAGVPWVPSDMMYLPGAWPHVICGRITSYITVFVTAERCLCIIAPLKVKEMVTPARTTFVIGVIYILNILTLIPEYATSYLDWKFFPETNRTLLATAFRSGRDQAVGLIFLLSFITGVTSFVALIFFTIILIVKLQQTSKWRKSATSGKAYPDSVSNREKKTVKMIIVIALILIFCYTPGAAVSMTTFIVPEFNIHRRYGNTQMAMWSIACVCHATNSSVNIFLYYTMSYKYRQTFHRLFALTTDPKSDSGR